MGAPELRLVFRLAHIFNVPTNLQLSQTHSYPRGPPTAAKWFRPGPVGISNSESLFLSQPRSQLRHSHRSLEEVGTA